MKPLRILLGNQTLSLLAGSETWTLTFALQLKKMGHDVEVFSPDHGIIAEKLKAAGITCHREIQVVGLKPFSIRLEPARKFEYDIIISNHHDIVERLRSQFPRTPIISTIHGIMHIAKDEKNRDVMAPEYPALNSGVNQFVAVSEEVKEKLRKDYNIDSVIIRNFFDIPKFEMKRPISNDKPQVFLLNTNYAESKDPEVQIIRDVARHYGARLIAVGQNFTMAEDLTKAINDADVVVGMGRSVLEGVAAGRLGIVHGRWGTGGIVCAEHVDALKYCNFSGRNSEGSLMTKEQLIEVIDLFYNEKTIEWGKQYVRTSHNAAIAAEAYIALVRGLLGQDIEAPGSVVKKYRRQKDVVPTP